MDLKGRGGIDGIAQDPVFGQVFEGIVIADDVVRAELPQSGGQEHIIPGVSRPEAAETHITAGELFRRNGSERCREGLAQPAADEAGRDVLLQQRVGVMDRRAQLRLQFFGQLRSRTVVKAFLREPGKPPEQAAPGHMGGNTGPCPVVRLGIAPGACSAAAVQNPDQHPLLIWNEDDALIFTFGSGRLSLRVRRAVHIQRQSHK